MGDFNKEFFFQEGGNHDGEVQDLYSGRDAITPFE